MAVMEREIEARRSLGMSRRRAVIVTAVVTLASIGLAGDLLIVGHTIGEEVWGVATAIGSAGAGGLSLAYLLRRSRYRPARIALLTLWLTVGLLGLAGLNSHRLPVREGASDPRPRPPLAPLVFTGFAIAGALAVRSDSKGD